MGSEIIIIIAGFFRWLFGKKKKDLLSEIYGENDNRIYRENYIYGMIVFIGLIVLFIIINKFF